MWSELGSTRTLWNLGCVRNFWSTKGYLRDPYNMGRFQHMAGCAVNYHFSKLLERLAHSCVGNIEIGSKKRDYLWIFKLRTCTVQGCYKCHLQITVRLWTGDQVYAYELKFCANVTKVGRLQAASDHWWLDWGFRILITTIWEYWRLLLLSKCRLFVDLGGSFETRTQV